MATQSIKRVTKLARIPLLVGLAFSLAALLAFGSVQPASASSCRHYATSTPSSHPTSSAGDYGSWYYAKTVWVQSWSACGDIVLQLGTIHPINDPNDIACAEFRVHFYPTNANDWRTGPLTACTSSGVLRLATHVINGTKYRVESNGTVQFGMYD